MIHSVASEVAFDFAPESGMNSHMTGAATFILSIYLLFPSLKQESKGPCAVNGN